MIRNKKNKLKKMCLNSKYCCLGEIYKLLDSKTIDRLLKIIPRQRIYKDSDENFLLILDKYIGYVRDTYHINHYELPNVLEETLKNKYNRVFISSIDIHSNIEYFKFEFKKVFLDNIFNNTLMYAKADINHKYKELQKAYNYLKNKNFDNINDINKIESFFIRTINKGKNDLYCCFKINNKVDENKIFFYTNQLNCLYEKYYH